MGRRGGGGGCQSGRCPKSTKRRKKKRKNKTKRSRGLKWEKKMKREIDANESSGDVHYPVTSEQGGGRKEKELPMVPTE